MTTSRWETVERGRATESDGGSRARARQRGAGMRENAGGARAAAACMPRASTPCCTSSACLLRSAFSLSTNDSRLPPSAASKPARSMARQLRPTFARIESGRSASAAATAASPNAATTGTRTPVSRIVAPVQRAASRIAAEGYRHQPRVRGSLERCPNRRAAARRPSRGQSRRRRRPPRPP
eukprot:6819064-Prymnesium_polylepis.1